MEKTQFSRAGKRRFNKRVNTLVSLLKQNEEVFLREWNKQVQGWLQEIHLRARNWREGAEFRNAESTDGAIEFGRPQIFGVLEIANALLKELGENAERMVGVY